MTDIHRLNVTARPGGLLFECERDDCGRRVVIDRDRGDVVVIDHGDRSALHEGFLGGVAFDRPVVRQT